MCFHNFVFFAHNKPASAFPNPKFEAFQFRRPANTRAFVQCGLLRGKQCVADNLRVACVVPFSDRIISIVEKSSVTEFVYGLYEGLSKRFCKVKFLPVNLDRAC